ncbi:hypothetical protein JX266_006793 [Neoarthrinium moseri]|nr:hypothetical protein JX266_006793 [Neoarthrinium moseri]
MLAVAWDAMLMACNGLQDHEWKVKMQDGTASRYGPEPSPQGPGSGHRMTRYRPALQAWNSIVSNTRAVRLPNQFLALGQYHFRMKEMSKSGHLSQIKVPLERFFRARENLSGDEGETNVRQAEHVAQGGLPTGTYAAWQPAKRLATCHQCLRSSWGRASDECTVPLAKAGLLQAY